MIAKLIVTVAMFGIATGAGAHPLPAAKTHATAREAELDNIMGAVQLDMLIARIVPADAAKRAAYGHRSIYASAIPSRAHDRG